MRVSLMIFGVLCMCVQSYADTSTVTVQQPVSTGGDFTFVLEKPNTNTGGSIDCNKPSSSCAPLNLSACSSTARDIVFTVQHKQGTVLPGRNLWIWLQKGTADCIYTTSASPHKLLNGDQKDATGLAVSGAVMRIPDDISDRTLSTDDLLKTGIDGNICTGSRTEATYRICVGIDNTNDGNIDANGSGFSVPDMRGYLQLQVDTVPPPTPKTPSVKALDARLTVSAGYSTDVDNDTVSYWETWTRSAPDTTDLGACSTWAEGTYSVVRVSGSASGTSLTVPSANGERVGVCVVAWDALGNASVPSAVVYGTAQDECDFFECAPADVQGGFCAAYGALWQVWCGVGLWACARTVRKRWICL